MCNPITREDILKDKECPSEYEDNLSILLDRCNKLQDMLGVQLHVTSGFRDMDTHLRIYREKGITDEHKIPMKSKHLYCQAVDFSDRDGTLKDIVKHLSDELLEELQLWYESFEDTKTWLHCQILPPHSGKRFFKP